MGHSSSRPDKSHVQILAESVRAIDDLQDSWRRYENGKDYMNPVELSQAWGLVVSNIFVLGAKRQLLSAIVAELGEVSHGTANMP